MGDRLNTLLELRKASKSYGKVQALQDIDLEIGDNEILGVLGDNGAGKSTLIKILSGYHSIDKGEIHVRGKKARQWTTEDARQLGIETVYQDKALADQQSVEWYIFMGREITGAFGRIKVKKQREETMKLMRDMGFTSKLLSSDSIVMNCSGGEREGIAISRAMYFKANLVILDEPTTALSVTETDKVLNFVSKIKERGGSCIVIMHNIYHAYRIAERFVIMDRGRLVERIEKAAVTCDGLIERMAMIASEGKTA
jgi:simple sugar transport system ATP-binding protein